MTVGIWNVRLSWVQSWESHRTSLKVCIVACLVVQKRGANRRASMACVAALQIVKEYVLARMAIIAERELKQWIMRTSMRALERAE